MVSKLHPLIQSSRDMRRAIRRLKAFKDMFPDHEEVKSGAVDRVVKALREAREHIPQTYRDADLK